MKQVLLVPCCVFPVSLFVWFSRQGFSVNSPGCPEIHFVDQASLEPTDPPASVSQVLLAF